MDSIEPSQDDRGAAQRFTARFAALWAEHRHVAERLAAIESSTAWAVARRLSQLCRRLAPEGSRRQWGVRLCVRGVRLWRREGTITLLRRTAAKLRRRLTGKPRRGEYVAAEGWDELARPTTLAGGTRKLAPSYGPTTPTPRSCDCRVAFIGSSAATEAPSMRYRAHHIIEALDLVGLEGTFVALENVRSNLPAILSHDLIVLVRMMHNDIAAELIGSARKRNLPLVFDLDDYLFDSWVMPYVEAMHHGMSQAEALRILDTFGACLDQCDYFTGSTSYLAAKAAEWGKESFVIRNGLSAAQLLLSQLALEQRSIHRRGPGMRIGYFSGTRTHQADFRVVYPALMRLLREQADARLVIVGRLDVGEFPGLAPFMDQIDLLPIRHWSELPAVITGVDINLIPLELTPFNEGKSNLKYYEAGLLKVPSIASPTRIHLENITPGYNGLLARTTEEWYNGLKELVTRPDRRDYMGQNAFDHIMKNYTPAAVAAEAVATYRQILQLHRSQRAAA
ncbi:MAG TPA: glycosyltransferase [Gemmataceae bacterium]|nr:glycosyltransferase [Gemmataceae bacterium]